MKKLMIFLLAFCPLWIQAQNMSLDPKLKSLVDAVLELRKGTEATSQKVEKNLSGYYYWTPMNEIGGKNEGECPLGKVSKKFKLNRILNQIAGSRVYKSTHGDMLNGEDSRFDYSLYERAVKGGKSVTYTLVGRVGKQCFVIVPFSKSGSGISATLCVDGGEPVSFSTNAADGTLVAWLDTPQLTAKQAITLTVTNGSKQNQAFVVLNHNSRK